MEITDTGLERASSGEKQGFRHSNIHPNNCFLNKSPWAPALRLLLGSGEGAVGSFHTVLFFMVFFLRFARKCDYV